ncbi:Magnesium transporter ALR2 [Leucoagaricus sp. SymC.cos]|nr:Magnesium transporter ALR2 [Leucoagaricus sp. SymC.cos]
MSSSQLESQSPIRQRLPNLTPFQADDAGLTDDDDIYRGERSPSARPSTPDTIVSSSPSSSSSSSSSSGSLLAGGRLGALTSIVEQAITRWARNARGRSSSSSSSSFSSSSSSSSSIFSKITASRTSLGRRRYRRSSGSSLLTMSSEKDIAVRITRMKALEESRQIPRQFILYLPPSLNFAGTSRRARRDLDAEDGSRQITQTRSLRGVLDKLGIALRKATKTRRQSGQVQVGTPRRSRSLVSRPLRQPRPRDLQKASRSPSSRSQTRGGRKGKHRESASHGRRLVRFSEPIGAAPKAWFLDVASPTWEDLRAIGKLLHLHPLTLEDILQQDPREKLDLFPKLGYYFISFRAIETRQGREKSQRVLQKMNDHLEPIAGYGEGVVRETNVYLVVFSEGICCFHYNDVAEHTDRIRNRIILLEKIASMSSDWIAHGILDSIIEKEATAIQELVFAPAQVHETNISSTGFKATVLPGDSPSRPTTEKEVAEKLPVHTTETRSTSEKLPHISGDVRPRFAAPRWTFSLVFRRMRRFLAKRWRSPNPTETPPSATTLTLRRMARVRRLVTSLNRLLASKAEVIAQIRKRLLKAGTSGPGNGPKAEELEVAIYLGDVQDHILTLQHSLNHYERVLSESHPTYLSQLRTSFATSKAGTSKNVVYLTTVSICVPCIQVVVAIFSMNVTVPQTETSFKLFGGVVCIAVFICCVYIGVVRYWWKQAGKKRRALL